MKKPLWVVLAIGVTAAAFALNFNSAVFGYPATIRDFVTTACNIAFWALYLACSRNGQKRLAFSCALSGVAMLCSLWIAIANFTGLTVPYLLGFIPIPFYGVRFFVHNMAWCMAAVTVLSGVWFGMSLVLMRRKKVGFR